MCHRVTPELFIGVRETPTPEGAALLLPLCGSFSPSDFKQYLPRKKILFFLPPLLLLV